MDATRSLQRESATRLFEMELSNAVRRAAADGVWPARLWAATAAAGLPAALLPEAAGGFGLSISEGLLPLQIVGTFAAPLPLAETMLAGWLLAQAGLEVPAGPLTVAPVLAAEALTLSRGAGRRHLSGAASRVPWSRDAAAIAVLATGGEGAGCVVRVPAGSWTARHDSNLAGEPRDSLNFDIDVPDDWVRPTPEGVGLPALRAGGAAMRSIMTAGAIACVLDMTVQYAGERSQFGRPIAKFQAVQQNLAVLAGQAAAAAAAAGIAVEGFAPGGGAGWQPNLVAIAAAKSRAGEAAGIAAAIAHQVFGAIGFTQEHRLHYWTKRLWSWRDEFGHEAEWNGFLGRHLAARGADRLWSEITAAA